MSNDRLFLVCKNCKAHKLMFKYYPGPYNERSFLQSYTVDVSEFVIKHVGCSLQAGEFDLGEDNCFDVLNEIGLHKVSPNWDAQ